MVQELIYYYYTCSCCLLRFYSNCFTLVTFVSEKQRENIKMMCGADEEFPCWVSVNKSTAPIPTFFNYYGRALIRTTDARPHIFASYGTYIISIFDFMPLPTHHRHDETTQSDDFHTSHYDRRIIFLYLSFIAAHPHRLFL